MQMTQTVAPPSYWDELYGQRKLAYDENGILFKDLFAKHLKPGGTCFEIGCYPAPFLIYLGKTFGYTVGGIDTTPGVTTVLPDFVRSHGVEVSEFVQGDFLTYDSDRQYDVVCSFGFIEHFLNYQEVIRQHIRLVKPGGTLVISCPNFRRLQWVFHRLFDAPNLRRHVLAAMNFRAWNQVLAEEGMQVLHQSYYGTCEVWRHREGPPRPILDRVAWRLVRLSQSVEARIRYPNRWTSPYMVTFARKAQIADTGVRQ